MTNCAKGNSEKKRVGMAQVVILREGESATTVLGSCIALALYHPRVKAAIVAHIVLAERSGREGPPGKFADSAIPHMLEELAKLGAGQHRVVAKLAGGANMFGGGGSIQVGQDNYDIVKRLLTENGIPILGEHVGGLKGRQITFSCDACQMTVLVAGKCVAQF